MLLNGKVVSPNQGFVFTQLAAEPRLFILLADCESRLGRDAITYLERKSELHDYLYLVNVSKTPNSLDLYYLRKLGVTVLPELRVYSEGHMTCTWRGLDQITTMSYTSWTSPSVTPVPATYT